MGYYHLLNYSLHSLYKYVSNGRLENTMIRMMPFTMASKI